MSFLGSMVGSMVGRAAMPVAALAGLGAYKSGAVDPMSFINPQPQPAFYEMQARVVAVENTCRLKARRDGKLLRTGAVPCSRAVDLMKSPAFKGFTLEKSEQVRYTYYSMDGTSLLSGTIPRLHDGKGNAYRKNDVIRIRVSSDDPSRSMAI